MYDVSYREATSLVFLENPRSLDRGFVFWPEIMLVLMY
jgi:hypothetical protein